MIKPRGTRPPIEPQVSCSITPWKPDDEDLTNWTIIGKANISDPGVIGGLIVTKEGHAPRVAFWDPRTQRMKSVPLG